MTRSKNANLTSETATRASYHGTNGRNQHSEMMPPLLHPLFMPPLLHPLSYSDLQSRNREFFPFLKLGSYVHEHPETSAPPFCPPFWYIWKVQDLLYNLCMYHFSSKCFVFAVQTHFLKTNQSFYYDHDKYRMNSIVRCAKISISL